MKRILPRAWSTDPFFRQIDELEGGTNKFLMLCGLFSKL